MQSLFPNRRCTVVASLGMLSELAFAVTQQGHAIHSGGTSSVLAVTFLIWFWISVTWLGWKTSDAVSCAVASTRRVKSIALIATATLVAAACILLYIASWGIFLQTKRYANWEAVRFFAVNTRMLWLHVQDADPVQIVWLILTVVGSLATLPLLGRWMVRGNRFSAETETNANNSVSWPTRRAIVWLGMILLLLMLRGIVANDLSIYRRFTRLDQLSNCLNPAVTLVTSHIESLSAEPIQPCLNTDELTPISPEADAKLVAQPLARRYNVVIVAIESLRADTIHQVHQDKEILPNINRLADNGLHLTQAYAQSTHSDYADVCLASSLYPLRTRRHHFYRRDDPWPKALLYDVLKPHGYATAIISSQNESWGSMDQFLASPNLDVFYHPETSEASTVMSDRDPGFLREHIAGALFAGKFPDHHTTDVALDWIDRQVQRDRPFFLAMNFQSSHFPYLIPDDAPRPFTPHKLESSIKFSSYTKEQARFVRNAFYNGIHECDQQVGRLVERLKELGQLDNTILIVTGENGEAFNENGETGHAGNPVQPQIHVAAILHAPKLLKPRVEDYPFEHVDLVPTLAELMGMPQHPNWQGIDVLSKDRLPRNERLVFVHVNSPIAKADAAILAGRWKWTITRGLPGGVLYDIVNDPTESTDVGKQHPEIAQQLRRALTTWRQQQLAYYHFPMYYQKYYPPKPPSNIAN